MKKLIVLFLLLPFVWSCQDVETRATKLAESFVKSEYPDIKNYQSVSTKVDTIYNSVLFAEGVFDSIQQYDHYSVQMEKYRHDIDRVMDIVFYGDSIPHDERMERLAEVQRDLNINVDSCQHYIDEIKKLQQPSRDYIRAMNEKIKDDHNLRWKVTHTYSSSDEVGVKHENSVVFFMTPDYEIAFDVLLAKEYADGFLDYTKKIIVECLE